jgi:outer membrane receptor protein involved in Fe transport
MGWTTRFCIGLAPIAASAPFLTAFAETTPKESVTVAATKPTVQVLPDRTVYSLSKNIQSSTSSLSDVLRNLPSIDVDIQGNVSLHGDANVTILVDGKQSPLLAGNRADALQQIPAAMIDRIEVITNPSAEFRAEGSGGVINIVLKKDKELVASGVVRLNLGSGGRLNLSASGNLKLGHVNLNGGYGEIRDGRKGQATTLRSDGTNLTSSMERSNKGVYSGRYTWLYASTDLNAQNAITLGSNYNRFAGHNHSLEHNIAAASDITRDGLVHWQREGLGGQTQYTHKFATKDEEFTLDLSHYGTWGLNGTDFTSLVTATGENNYWQSQRSIWREGHTEFKADYTRPLPHDGKVKVGYALQNDANVTDNHGLFRDTTMATPANDPSFTNNFLLDRTIHAGYVTYEQKFGPLGVMGGVRMEQDYLTTNLKTTGEVHDTAILGLYPSLHLSYGLTDTQQLQLSYSRRMNRPDTYSLNPARYSNDAFNVWAGNPYLKPEQIDSFETAYRYTGEKLDAVMTGYYRVTYKGITNVYRYLSNTVLLTTPDNLARRMASGVEANLNAKLLSGLSLRSTATLSYNEFNPGAAGLGKKQSGMGWSIKGGLDWQPTPDDLVQFNANYAGKQRFAQGYSEPTLSGDLGYKHSFEGGFAGVMSLNNLFASWNRNTVLDSPGLHQVDHRTTRGRVLFLGLVYTFGGFKETQSTTGGGNEGGNAGGPPGQ